MDYGAHLPLIDFEAGSSLLNICFDLRSALTGLDSVPSPLTITSSSLSPGWTVLPRLPVFLRGPAK